MASLIQNPPRVGFTQDPIIATIGTTKVNPVFAKAVLVFSALANQDAFTMAWGSRSETIVFKTVADIGGANELVIPTGGFDETYLNYVKNVLLSNDRLSQDFKITVSLSGSNMRIEFKSWSVDPLTITITTTPNPLSTLTKTITQSTGPYTEPNLSALLTVNLTGTDKELIRLTQPYQIFPNSLVEKGQSEFDIKAAFNLKPHLPQDLIIDHDIASSAFAEYYLRFADRFGSIPKADAMTKSSNYYAIHGTKNDLNFDGAVYSLCHIDTEAIVSRHQAAWVYFFTPSVIDTEDNFVYVQLFKQDGTTFEYRLDNPIAFLPNTLYFFRSDYVFLQIESTCNTLNINPKSVRAYSFRIKNNNDVIKLQRVHYIKNDLCDGIQLAFDNGLGGIETVTMHPRHVRKIEAERTNIQLEGSDTEWAILPRAKKIWELKTDLVNEKYAEILSQLLLGNVWIIDPVSSQFIPIIADTKSVEIKPVRGFVQLSITFKSSKTYKSL